jgi:hypothetical protein
MTLLKKIVLSVLLAIGVAFFIEAVAHVSYRVIFKTGYNAQEVISKRKQLLLDGHGSNQDELQQRAYLIHPYYGYVSDTTSALPGPAGRIINSARAFGFDCDEQIIPDYPEQVFTVAIMGGSVAKYFAANMAEDLAKQLQMLPQTRGKKIAVLSLANYSYKQPQQLLILADLIALGSKLDLVINIDGFNEVAHPLSHNAPNGVDPFFPSGWADRTGEIASSKELSDLGRIQVLRDLRVRLATLFPAQLNRSITCNVLWAALDALVQKNIHELEASRLSRAEPAARTPGQPMGKGPSGKVSFGSSRVFDAKDFYPAAARHWAAASAMANNLVVHQGGRYFHFLQPNQYDQGSKRLTQEELTQAFNPASPYRTGALEGYGQLRKAGKLLADAGVAYTDLSGLFAREDRSLYADDCCHYNRDGESLMSEAIGGTITSNWARPSEPADISQLRRSLDEGLEDPGRIPRLANLNCDLLADAPCKDVRISGLLDVETNPGKPQERWRWGLRPGTSIVFFAPQGAVAKLSAELLSTLTGQAVTVTHNGRPLAAWTQLDPSGKGEVSARESITFPTDSGANEITLSYSKWANKNGSANKNPDQHDLAVVYYSLRLETSPPPPGGPR